MIFGFEFEYLILSSSCSRSHTSLPLSGHLFSLLYLFVTVGVEKLNLHFSFLSPKKLKKKKKKTLFPKHLELYN